MLDRSLLLRGRLHVRVIRILVIRLTMAHDAPSRGAEFSMSDHVTGDPPTMAPLMQPLASASGTSEREIATAPAAAMISFIGKPPRGRI